MKREINPSEEKITAEWIESENDVVRDENCNRVIYLTENYLEELVVDSTNWEILYRDPKDGRFWVKTYPQSNLHGGGPPELEVISKEETRKHFKYIKLNQMTDERIAAIIFGSALILFGIFGSIVSGKSLKSETNPSSITGLRQAFFTSIGGIVLGFFIW